MNKVLFFSREFSPGSGVPPEATIPGQYVVSLWRPPGNPFRDIGRWSASYLTWWLFHQIGVFVNKDYCALEIHFGQTLVHRSSVFPGFFRFPFMAPSDLQIGATWTHPAYEGRGLATYAVSAIVRALGSQGRTIWYLTSDTNAASIRVIQKSGFRLRGWGSKLPRWGVRMLGYYAMNELLPGPQPR